MLLISCKAHLKLNWIEGCILSNVGDSAKFKIKDAKLHVPIVSLSNKDNVNLTKQLSDGFKGCAYWSNYQTTPAEVIDNGANIYKLLNAPFKGIKRLFVFAYDATGDDTAGIKNNKQYFLPKAEIKNYNVLIDGRNLYDQPINDLIKQYNEVRKVSIGQGKDYATGYLLGYAYFTN